MRTVYLHGHLKEQFGEKFQFDAPNAQQIIGAMVRQIKGFGEALKPGEYQCIYGSQEKGMVLDEKGLYLNFGKTTEFHIVPVIQGAGGRRGGIFKTILGITLVAIGVAGAFLAGGLLTPGLIGPATAAFGAGIGGISFGTIATVGLALTLTGVSSLLSPKPQVDALGIESQEDQTPSTIWNGPINLSAQGQPIALAYGRVAVGSMVISSGISTEVIEDV